MMAGAGESLLQQHAALHAAADRELDILLLHISRALFAQ